MPCERRGVECPFDTEAVFRACADDPHWIEGIGDLGLLIWVTAEYAPERLDDLFERVNLEKSLERFADARKCRTMELSWFLAGLCHATVAAPKCPWPLGDLAVDTYHLLQDDNRRRIRAIWPSMRGPSRSAAFCGGVSGPSLIRSIRSYALSKFATVFIPEGNLWIWRWNVP